MINLNIFKNQIIKKGKIQKSNAQIIKNDSIIRDLLMVCSDNQIT